MGATIDPTCPTIRDASQTLIVSFFRVRFRVVIVCGKSASGQGWHWGMWRCIFLDWVVIEAGIGVVAVDFDVDVGVGVPCLLWLVFVLLLVLLSPFLSVN